RYQAEYLRLIDGLSDAAVNWPAIELIDSEMRNAGCGVRSAEQDMAIPRSAFRIPRSALPRVNVSIKLSSLYSQFDPIDPHGTSAAVRARLRPVLRAARDRGAFVNIDMEQYAFKDLTLAIFREV